MDEPFSAGDCHDASPPGRSGFLKIWRPIPVTILFVTHLTSNEGRFLRTRICSRFGRAPATIKQDLTIGT